MDATDSPSKYGNHYWRVGLSDGRETRLFADAARVADSGALVFTRSSAGETQALAGFGPGAWRWFIAASRVDGKGVSVDVWPADPEDHR